MDAVAEKINKLLEAHFTAITSQRKGEGVGLYSVNPSPPEWFHRSSFAEIIRNQFKIHIDDQTALRKMDIERTGLPWPILDPIRNLTFLSLQFPHQPPFGMIVVGSEKPLSHIAEVAFIALTQHLVHLARFSDMDIELQTRNQFLSIASHELKTPLTSIYGILQLQERMLRPKKDQVPFPEQERQQNLLKMVIRQTERLNELIDGLLNVSRIQNGRFMVEPSETDVAKLLRECALSRLAVLAQEGGVKLHLDSLPELIAWVDPVRLEEVATNLVTNAIRLSPEGGVVWIKLREEGDSFRLTVRDQGPSIPIEDRERIFQPFERLPKITRIGGLGLGLFISRQIAQLHGGNVSLIESVPGKGNVFEAYFPMHHPFIRSPNS